MQHVMSQSLCLLRYKKSSMRYLKKPTQKLGKFYNLDSGSKHILQVMNILVVIQSKYISEVVSPMIKWSLCT